MSTDHSHFAASAHRYHSVDDRPGGPGVHIEEMECDLPGAFDGRRQPTTIGSFATAELTGTAMASAQTLVVSLGVYSTLHSIEEQRILHFDHHGRRCALELCGRDVRLVVAGHQYVVPNLKVSQRRWYRAVIVSTPTGVRARVSDGTPGGIRLVAAACEPEKPVGTDLFVLGGASTGTAGSFNGKLAEVRVGSGPVTDAEEVALLEGETAEEILGSRLVAGWEFGDGDLASSSIPNIVAGAPTLRLTNMPCRAVTGPRWSGRQAYPASSAREYDAIHFNDDMVIGGEWDESLRLRVPDTWGSGIYGLRVTDQSSVDIIPFYVRPGTREARKNILFLAPTNTYLAYGNEHNATADIGADLGSLKEHEVIPQEADTYVDDHPELGLSLYDWHRDGTGVRFASRLRPLLNMRPFHRNWLNDSYRHFGADFYLIEWLRRRGFDFDVATDEDLHREGRSLLDSYRVVLTGSHPEYVSERMVDAIEEYRRAGGNLMYLGGNGFYWPVAYSPHEPAVIEMRRGVSGARNFDSPPGEAALSFTGESGGIWRNRGRSPHRLLGVGMGAVGWGRAQPYRRTPSSYSDSVRWVFDGVDDELIGDDGLMLGGAAGDEMDHIDFDHGTPPETVVLASSVGHDDRFQPASEYYTNIYPDVGGSKNPLVRADMTLLGDGHTSSVFSVGSICWVGALPVDGFDGPVSRLTHNVLARFSAVPNNDAAAREL
nr:N,N-dimethylformamidase beta subunit family domain-containing protein [Gordonia sp. LAM0048]